MQDKDRPPDRALILQGGGALGAYEVGALKGFFDKLSKEDRNSKKRKGRPMFDIVAGASIGAVNATILVDNVIHQKNKGADTEKIWEDAIGTLSKFYEKISQRGGTMHPMWWIDNVFLNNLFFRSFWSSWAQIKEFVNKQNEIFYKNSTLSDKEKIQEFIANSPLLGGLYFWIFPDKWGLDATEDLARRYYSYTSSIFLGSPGVLSPAMIQPDLKFLDPFYWTHVFARYNNNPLTQTMKEFCTENFLIKTNRENEQKEPRLLVMAIDVGDFTTPVVFDSFAKKKKDEQYIWYSDYGLGEGTDSRFRIEYNGIEMKHIEASMATPLRYEYPTFNVKNLEDGKITKRTFWDGAFLANTPLRQVMQAHKQYWLERGETDIPELEIFIVNLYPATEKRVPSSPDAIQDRQIDITFHDRTKYEVRIDQMRSDYVEMVNDLKKLAEKHDPKMVEEILEKNSRKQEKDGKFVKKRGLVEEKFSLGRVVYVERIEEAGSTIFAKAFDFSPQTIKNLIDNGEKAAKIAFDKCTKSHEDFYKNR
ncbi:MAG: patatin-like phospholipase family protein [Nitrosarchaeum sp.]|nr:patatin-like phospholipase family protein [Nitrosarchaeum sp.]